MLIQIFLQMDQKMQNYTEKPFIGYKTSGSGGILFLLGIIGALIVGVILLKAGYEANHGRAYRGIYTPVVLMWFASVIMFVFVACGFTSIDPNQRLLIQKFGNEYVGTLDKVGWVWMMPFLYSANKIDLAFRNETTSVVRTNDKHGNLIEISAVVQWRVTDVAKAVLDYTDYQTFISSQLEGPLRDLAGKYAFDSKDESEQTLCKSGDNVTKELIKELQEQLHPVGIEIGHQTRIAHLSYASEIAAAMLQRQKARATLDAREELIKGTEEIVNGVIKSMKSNEDIEFTKTDAGKLASNLMIVLASDKGVTPTISVNADHH